MKKILVLTSGGDCSGMNAYLKALAKLCKKHEIELFASMYGFQGLVENSITSFEYDDLGEIQNLGGSVIKTSRSKDFVTQKGFEQALSNLKTWNFDCVVVVGGNGSTKGAYDLSLAEISVVTVPATIDNDLGYTDTTLGYDTACQNALDAVVKIKQTMDTCDRGAIVEVMGRHCSDIAVHTAILADADMIITKQKSFESILKRVDDLINFEKKNPLIVVQENILNVNELAKYLEEHTKKEFRATVIGYLQRGGAPTVNDNLLAIQFATKTVELIESETYNVAVGEIDSKITATKLQEAIITKQHSKKLLEIFKKYSNTPIDE